MNVRQRWGVSGALERGRPGRSSRGKRRATRRATRRIWPNANDARSQRAATSGKDGCVVRSRQRRGVSRQITDENWAWKASRTYLAVGGQGVRLDDRGRVGGRDAEGGDRGDAKHRDRRASLCDEPSFSLLNAFFVLEKMRFRQRKSVQHKYRRKPPDSQREMTKTGAAPRRPRASASSEGVARPYI